MRILLGAFSTQTGSLGVREHGSIENGAVGKHAHHQGDGAPEATCRSLHGISGNSPFAVGLDIVSLHTFCLGSEFPGDLSPCWEHFGDGCLRFGGGSSGNGLCGHGVHDTQDRGAHEAYRGQDQSHIGKIRFSSHIYFLPNLRWWNFMLISGTAVFISRMAKDIPSG